jgi:hypothetical protein
VSEVIVQYRRQAGSRTRKHEISARAFSLNAIPAIRVTDPNGGRPFCRWVQAADSRWGWVSDGEPAPLSGLLFVPELGEQLRVRFSDSVRGAKLNIDCAEGFQIVDSIDPVRTLWLSRRDTQEAVAVNEDGRGWKVEEKLSPDGELVANRLIIAPASFFPTERDQLSVAQERARPSPFATNSF